MHKRSGKRWVSHTLHASVLVTVAVVRSWAQLFQAHSQRRASAGGRLTGGACRHRTIRGHSLRLCKLRIGSPDAKPEFELPKRHEDNKLFFLCLKYGEV